MVRFPDAEGTPITIQTGKTDRFRIRKSEGVQSGFVQRIKWSDVNARSPISFARREPPIQIHVTFLKRFQA